MSVSELIEHYRHSKEEDLSISDLSDILELGTFLEMDCARDTAISRLSLHPDLPSVLKLSLGISFCVSQWIEPAFLHLLGLDINLLTTSDFILLGPAVLRILVTTQSTVSRTRLLIGLNPYKLLHQPTCNSPGPEFSLCQNKWSDAWRLGFGPHYIHPDIHLTPADALEKLSTLPMKGVTPQCRAAAIQRIKESKVFEKETEIISKAVDEVRALEGTKWYRKL